MSSAALSSERAGGGAGGGLCCPSCGSRRIEQQDATGASVCTECGVVLEENAIVSSVEFVDGAGGGSSMIGQFVSAASTKAYTSGGGGGGGGGGRPGRGWGFSRDSRETTLANGRRRIQEVASRLRLGGHYVDSAHRLFTIAVEKNFVQGRRTTHVVAACLYISCRQQKSEHMLIDFSDALQVNVYALGTCFLKFRRLLGLSLEILDPALYVYRFAAHLELDDKANTVALTALRLVGRMKRDWMVAGRRPAGICAAALLIAARAHGFSKHPEDVTRILRVCGMTVRTRVKEFEQTPSAALTLEQFQRGEEFTREMDPPIFTRNRMLEARARAIQENNIALLTSGALDDPSKAGKKSAQVWRNSSISETMAKRHAKFEELYQSLELEMNQTPADPTTTTTTTTTCKMDEDDDDDDAEKESTEGNKDESGEKEVTDKCDDDDKVKEGQNNIDDNKKVSESKKDNSDEAEEHDEEDKDQTSKEDKNVNEEGENDMDKKHSATPSMSTALTLRDNQHGSSDTCASNAAAIPTIPSEWKQAYPKSKFGKAIILPDHATAEERMPSVVPVEGILDLRSWKDHMPDQIVQDVEDMLRSPTEVAQKEAIFNKINKDYITLQAQKEKNRETAEQTAVERDEELIAQAQGLERYRKRKNRGTGADLGDSDPATTEEALLLAVANRKISRKINYDAMSAIFDQDGTFSTTDEGPQERREDEDPSMAYI